jgi:hypothetical protein
MKDHDYKVPYGKNEPKRAFGTRLLSDNLLTGPVKEAVVFFGKTFIVCFPIHGGCKVGCSLKVELSRRKARERSKLE